MRAWERTVIGFACMATAMLLSGCAQPPTQQLEAAQKGVEAARAAGAAEYAKEEFRKLEQDFTLAQEEMARQEKTLSIFRSYSEADEMLTRVADAAKQVEAKAAAAKEEAKTAAIAVEKEAQTAVASAQDLLAKAPVGKDRAAVEAIKQDLAGLEAGLGTVHQLIEKGDYLGAEAQAKALKEKVAAVSEEIQQAIEKAGGKRTKTRIS